MIVLVLHRPAQASDRAAASSEASRLDRWLWTVRIFKTRSAAATACRAGSVLVGEAIAKAARELRVGDVVTVRRDGLRRVFAVLGFPASRVGAKLVAEHCTDRTPPEELARAQAMREAAPLQRARGAGRPTKRERRQVDDLLGGT